MQILSSGVMKNRGLITISESGAVSVPSNVQMADFEIAQLLGVMIPTIRCKVKTLLKSRYISDCSGGIVSGRSLMPEYFGLEVVVAIAFQVDSYEADIFRRWVMKRLTQADAPPIYISMEDMSRCNVLS